jgi:hypothetical protein
MENRTQNANPYAPPEATDTICLKRLRLIPILRNFIAMSIVLCVSALIMHVEWPAWICNLGTNGDLYFVALCAGGTGLIAAMIGTVNVAIWFPIWLLGVFISHTIIDPPDPEWMLGLAIHAVVAFPILLIGFFTKFIKKKLRKGENSKRLFRK